MEKLTTKRIAVIAPFVGDGKEILLGIASAISKCGHWVLRPIDSLSRLATAELKQWNPKGAIVFGPQEEAEAFLIEKSIPYVRVLEHRPGDSVSTVSIDDQAVARMAAEYFLGRNFEHFAYCGNEDHSFSIERGRGFASIVEAAGKKANFFFHPSAEKANRHRQGLMHHEGLGKWLMSLPKPVALFASNDWDALEASQACAFSGIRVPDEVSILGVGNDELACLVARPELSSIQLPLRLVAQEAVMILAPLLERNRSFVARSIQMKPVALVTRASTQFLPVDDLLVAKTLGYMDEHMNKPIKIQDLLRHFGVSRSHLEQRFRAVLGRTPLVELRRLRIERARRFLSDTDLSMKKIASLSGFSSEIRFTTVFREITGKSPTEFTRSLAAETLR